MSEQQRVLTDRIEGVRRRFLWIGSFSGIVWAIIAAVLVILAGVWFDLLWELSPAARRGVLWSGAMGGAAVLAMIVWRTLQRGLEQDAARRIDRAAGAGGAVLTGLQLADWRPGASDSKNPQLTSGMAQMAVERASRIASGVSNASAVSAKPLGRSVAAFIGLAMLGGLLVLALPSLASVQWNRFLHPTEDVPPFSRIEFEIEPGDVAVRYGDSQEITVRTSGAAVERVELVLIGSEEKSPGDDSPNAVDTAASETLPMFPEPDGRWRAVLAKVTEPGRYFARAHGARSRQHKVEVITIPEIESVCVRITPPAYTGQSAYEGPVPKEGIVGVLGTKVLLTARSNRPLADGELRIESRTGAEDLLFPAMTGSSEVACTFEITQDAKLSLRLRDRAGQWSSDQYATTIRLLADQRPFVRITSPKAVSLATPNSALPIEIAAEDDFGIARVQLFRGLNGSRPLPVDLLRGKRPQRRFFDRNYLPLASYGLEAGDVIKLFARVEDNDPAGAKGAESKVVTVHIISQSDFEQMVRRRQGMEMLLSKYRQAERRMENIAKELEDAQKNLEEQRPGETPEEAKERQRKAREDLDRLTRKMQEEAKAIREAAKQAFPYDVDKNLTPELEKVAKELDEAAKEMKKLLDELKKQNASDAEMAKKLAALAKKLGQKLRKKREEFKKAAMMPLETLKMAMPLMIAQNRFVQLVARQTDLAERLTAMKGKVGSEAEDDPDIAARMRDLEDEQRQLELDLEELLSHIESHAALLPDEEQFDDLRLTATEFALAVRLSGADMAMAEASDALAEFDGTEGHQKAEEAAEILRKFLKQCNGMGGACKSCLKFSPGMSNCMGNTPAQMMADMGMGSGMGGAGGGAAGMGGYSARRGPGGNVGLYGGLPTIGGGAGAGRTNDDNAGAEGGAMASGAYQGNSPDAFDATSETKSSGAADAAIPVRYRRRVGDYFRRLAEEE